MQPIYEDSTQAELEAKRRFHFPEFIMMENAAAALEKQLYLSLSDISSEAPSVLILCGSGNNGADGLALARRICGKMDVAAVVLKDPSTPEAKQQYRMALDCGVTFFTADEALQALEQQWDVIFDCIYGTGFHGELNQLASSVVQAANDCDSFRIACDIPSGIDKSGVIATVDEKGEKVAFKANKTVTMGALKAGLYSDAAKDFCGEVIVAELGISSELFCSCYDPDIFLLEADDINLPERSKKSCHKGNFGQTAVIIGEKPGAGIIAATAALKAGSGYSWVVTEYSENIQNFALSPELMHSEKMPASASSVLIGSGLGRNFNNDKVIQLFSSVNQMILSSKNKAAVLDADFFYHPELKSLLDKLNNSGCQIILTPHPKELYQILNACTSGHWEMDYVIENRLELTKMLGSVYPNLVFVSKGAVTYITKDHRMFVCNCGSAALAKAGSGDVLAGLCAGLLAQNYNALEAAKTAVWLHAKASNEFQPDFSLTPKSLIEKIR